MERIIMVKFLFRQINFINHIDSFLFILFLIFKYKYKTRKK